MDPINGLGPLTEIVRRKLREGASAERGSGIARRSSSSVRPEVSEQTRRLAVGELEKQLRLKLKELGPEAAHSPGARRVIIASLLMCELDDRLHNESRFNLLVRAIQRSIDEDERLRARFDAVINQLSG